MAAGTKREKMKITDCIELSTHRQKILSNEQILFLKSQRGDLIHDKNCPVTWYIPDGELVPLKTYDTNLRPCPQCARNAYLRVGAKDYYHHKKYLEYFARLGMDEALLRRMYVEKGMKTSLAGGLLTVWYKEDRWQICPTENDKPGKVQLRHNNYRMKPDGSREFLPGYHIQSKTAEGICPRQAVKTLEQYRFDAHRVEAQLKNLTQAHSANPESRLRVTPPAPPAAPCPPAAAKKPFFTRWLKALLALLKCRSCYRMDLGEFWDAKEVGMPPDGTLCIYVWQACTGKVFWQTGMYLKDNRQFAAYYKDENRTVNEAKVLAWKPMNDKTTFLYRDCAPATSAV